MVRKSPDIDVFLSSSPSPSDDSIVQMVQTTLENAGLRVWNARQQCEPGTDLAESIRRAIAEAQAVIVLVTPATLTSGWIAVEVGAAIALNKTIHVLYKDLQPGDAPAFLGAFKMSPVAKTADVASMLSEATKPLTATQVEALTKAYKSIGIPTDRLALHPADLRRVADLANKGIGTASGHIAESRVLAELIRLRKRSRLPRLGRR